jgi:hypothetical protein
VEARTRHITFLLDDGKAHRRDFGSPQRRVGICRCANLAMPLLPVSR